MANQQIPTTRPYCKNCRFWGSLTSIFVDVAECRRAPPVRTEEFMTARPVANPAARMRERGKGVWPLVAADDQCGEFSRG